MVSETEEPERARAIARPIPVPPMTDWIVLLLNVHVAVSHNAVSQRDPVTTGAAVDETGGSVA